MRDFLPFQRLGKTGPVGESIVRAFGEQLVDNEAEALGTIGNQAVDRFRCRLGDPERERGERFAIKRTLSGGRFLQNRPE